MGNNVPMTLTLFKSTKSKLSAGYLHIPWKDDNSGYAYDDKALVLSVTE